MSTWKIELPSAYDEEFPMPTAGVQSWSLDLIKVLPVVGLPTKAVTSLSEEQRDRERAAERLRRSRTRLR
jgi:hypothetical protein